MNKLFRRRQPVPEEVRAALSELARVVDDRPFLRPHAAVLAEILPVVFADSIEPASPIDEERARAKLQAGVPFLNGESVSFDVVEFKRRWQAICKSVARHAAGPNKSRLANLLGRDGWGCETLARDVLAGDISKIESRAQSDDVAGEPLRTVLRFTLLPVLLRLRLQQAAALRQCPWQAGSCPVCGSWPLLAEFRGLEQIRFLRCGLCAADWEFPRLQCPHCDNRDHHQLGYFHVEQEEDKFRVATCEKCQGYVKTASTLGALDGPQLLVLDLETLHLDLAALDRGYRNP